MLNSLWKKLKESIISVLPISLIVILLSFTSLYDLSTYELLVFILCSVLLIIGISLFNLGADLAMQPMGEKIGSALTKQNKILLILIVSFILGVLITIAEPDLSVLANQVKAIINQNVLLITIGVGVGFFLVISIIKIIYKIELTSIIMFFYLIVFCFVSILIERGNASLLALCFDSGGVTTGPITVPFIMALGVGIAQTIGGKNSSENSFGLIALCSIGPVLAMIILGIASKGNLNYQVPSYEISSNLLNTFGHEFLITMKDVGIALGLICIFFLIIEAIFIKLPKAKLIHIGVGIIYTFFGLVIFLTAANVGFMPIGYHIGNQIAKNNKFIVMIFGFALGLVVVLAEPAIHVLTKQVDDVTNGQISKKPLLIALSLGVGLSILLSIIRIIFNFSILYYVIPGYIISIGLSFFIPRIYTAIAFDSGGVASGPLTSSFILPFAIGICSCLYPGNNDVVLKNAFGVVALVALTPLISIQLLGFKSILTMKIKKKTRMKKILDSDDEKIISFD